VASHVQNPPPTVTGAVVYRETGYPAFAMVFRAPRGEYFSSQKLSFTPAPGTSSDVALATPLTPHVIGVGSTDSGNGTGTLTFAIRSENPAITYSANETVKFNEVNGILGVSSTSSQPSETWAVSVFNDNATGAVYFSGTITSPPSGGSGPLTFSQSNLPAGLVSGNPLVPGTAYPRIYTGVIYTATDVLGSTFSGTFTLHVYGHVVVPPPPVSNYGNEVNPFGNGFDAYQQHQYPGAIVAGWTATQADPATHFIRLPGTVPGAYKFEYAPNGAASGLCVSDPGGGWASDPLPDGLILTVSNSGPWQQFIPQPDGTLRNVATGLVVSPNGTGAQLRGTVYPTPWGGSFYTWTPFSNLPG
jgi:hypothetical protein